MANINKVALSGYIGREPEVRTTQTGLTILTFSLAVNDYVKNSQTGIGEEYTNWISCTLFGKTAESLQAWLHQGTKVCVEGKLHYSSWQAEDGTKRSKINVNVNSLDLCGSASIGGEGKENVPAIERGVQENEQARMQTEQTVATEEKRNSLSPSENIAQASARADEFNRSTNKNYVSKSFAEIQNAQLAEEDIPF